MKRNILLLFILAFCISCGGKDNAKSSKDSTADSDKEESAPIDESVMINFKLQ